MNQDYYPLIALIFVIPIMISPITIDALEIDIIEISVVVQFEYPKSLNDLRTDIEIQLIPQLQKILTAFGVSSKSTNFNMKENFENIVYLLEHNSTSGKNIYEINPQIAFSLTTNLSLINYETEFNIATLIVKDQIVSFLSNNNATNGKSVSDLSWGEVIKNEAL